MKKAKLKVIKTLIETNDLNYNKLKAAEELQELSLALTQQLLKPTRITDEAVIDEIGDVWIRMQILMKLYDKKKVNDRIVYKLNKFSEYFDKRLYKGSI